MDARANAVHPSPPILQQLFECSNPEAEICGLAMVVVGAGRRPQALVFHDAKGLAVNAFLTQAARALTACFGGLSLFAHDLRSEASHSHRVQVESDSNQAARIASSMTSAGVAEVMGVPIGELTGVIDTIRRAHADFVPSLPDSWARGPDLAGCALRPAHEPVRRSSGWLLESRAHLAGVVLHDVNPGSSFAVNSYLSAVVADKAAQGWWLAERSLKDADDRFCRVRRCLAEESALPVRSTSSVEIDEVADRLGVEPGRLARLIDSAADARRWRSPFQSARRLDVSARPRPAGVEAEMIVA